MQQLTLCVSPIVPMRSVTLAVLTAGLMAGPTLAQTGSPPKAKAKSQTEAKAPKKSLAGAGTTRISNSPYPTYDNEHRAAHLGRDAQLFDARSPWRLADPAGGRHQARPRRVRARGRAVARAPRHHRRPRRREHAARRRLRRQSHRRHQALPVAPRARRHRHDRPAHARRAQRAGDAAAAPARGLARPARRHGFHVRRPLRGGEHPRRRHRGGRERPRRAAPRRHRRQARPAVADAHDASHGGQSQSDLDRAARHPEEGHPHQDAPRPRLRRAHAHARARRLRPRDRSGFGKLAIPTARRTSRCGRIPAPGTRSVRVRFDMPNPHSVYLHDTNNRSLFSADYRFQSSGCARIENPRDSRGLAAAGQGELEPRADRRRDRDRPAPGHPPRPARCRWPGSISPAG